MVVNDSEGQVSNASQQNQYQIHQNQLLTGVGETS
jgi:hypothetical protein